MARADSPAEMAGPHHSKEAVSRHPYAQIVVALDGSALAEQVLGSVEPLAKAFGSTVTCVCAVEPISATALAGTGTPGAYISMLETAAIHLHREMR